MRLRAKGERRKLSGSEIMPFLVRLVLHTRLLFQTLLLRRQAVLTELDGERLARSGGSGGVDGEVGGRRVLRTNEEARTVAARVADAALSVAAVTQKVRPLGEGVRAFLLVSCPLVPEEPNAAQVKC